MIQKPNLISRIPVRLLSGIYVGMAVLSLSLTACDDKEVTPVAEKFVFWSSGGDTRSLYRARFQPAQIPDTTQAIGPALGRFGDADGFAVDTKAQRVYYFSGDSIIRQLDFNLRNRQEVGRISGEGTSNIFGSQAPYGQVGPMVFAGNRLYWSQGGNGQWRIARVNPDGSNLQMLYQSAQATSDTLGIQGLAQPEGSEYLYWGTRQKVWRGRADGSATPTMLYNLATALPEADLNDLTVWQDKIYLATTNGLWQGNLDGSGNLTQLFTTGEAGMAKNILTISTDPATGQLYWFGIIPGANQGRDYQFLFRAKPDGSGLEKLLERAVGEKLSVF